MEIDRCDELLGATAWVYQNHRAADDYGVQLRTLDAITARHQIPFGDFLFNIQETGATAESIRALGVTARQNGVAVHTRPVEHHITQQYRLTLLPPLLKTWDLIEGTLGFSFEDAAARGDIFPSSTRRTQNACALNALIFAGISVNAVVSQGSACTWNAICDLGPIAEAFRALMCLKGADISAINRARDLLWELIIKDPSIRTLSKGCDITDLIAPCLEGDAALHWTEARMLRCCDGELRIKADKPFAYNRPCSIGVLDTTQRCLSTFLTDRFAPQPATGDDARIEACDSPRCLRRPMRQWTILDRMPGIITIALGKGFTLGFSSEWFKDQAFVVSKTDGRYEIRCTLAAAVFYQSEGRREPHFVGRRKRLVDDREIIQHYNDLHYEGKLETVKGWDSGLDRKDEIRLLFFRKLAEKRLRRRI